MTEPMLTQRQREVFDFIRSYARDHGYPPAVRDIGRALGLASPSTVHVSADEIAPEQLDAERKVFEAKAREEGKPDNVVEKIVEGQLNKWSKEIALLDQEHVRTDRYEGKTIEQLRADIAAKTGENIRIARFARFVVGQD